MPCIMGANLAHMFQICLGAAGAAKNTTHPKALPNSSTHDVVFVGVEVSWGSGGWGWGGFVLLTCVATDP